LSGAPYCVLVHPPADSERVGLLAGRCRKLADAAGYKLKALRAESLRVVGGSGRRLSILRPLDASTLYRDLHRAPAMVAALAPAFVRLDPSCNPPNRRSARSLSDFVAYKAAYGLVRSEVDARRLFEAFAEWRKAVHCRDPSDPRALPLHVFDLGGDSFDLACDGDVDRFSKTFGNASRRCDGAGRSWRAGVAHGREALHVAGLTLPAGTHWDVSADARSWRIMNASEIWEIDLRGYVNAAPNEHLRGPQRKSAGKARRVWRANTKNAPHRKKKGH